VRLYGDVIAKLLVKRDPSSQRIGSFCSACEPAILGTIIRSLAWRGYWPLPAAMQIRKKITQLAFDFKNIDVRDVQHTGSSTKCVGLGERDRRINEILQSVRLQITPSQISHMAEQAKKSGLWLAGRSPESW
jgi:hypothetical protein